MKTHRLPLFAALLLGLCAATLTLASPPAPAAKAKTYAIVGFFDGLKPSTALLEQASRDIGEKMKGLAQVENPEDADHVVQVLFKRGAYKVYVDALPLDGIKRYDALDRLRIEGMLASEAARENAEGHGRK